MYGIGDEDALHFRLPDLRGRVPMGVDAEGVRIGNAKKMGVVGGKAVHVLSIDQLPSHDHDPGYLSTERTGNHTHDIHDPGHAHHIARNLVVGHGPNTGPYGTTRDQWLRHERPDTERSVTGIEIHSSGAHTHKITGRTASTGGGQQFSLVQPYQAFNYIIYAGN
jgi:microcystin-dependent protein